MPTYCYQCNHCKNKKVIEVFHSMNYVGNESSLPIETLNKITCSKHGLMTRIPQEPQLMGMSGGQSKSEAELRKDKQKQRKLRSKLHFKNEGIKEVRDPWSRKYFEKKIQTDPLYKELKGDHEKERKKYL